MDANRAPSTETAQLKDQVAAHAAALVPDGVILGLGSGTTVRRFLVYLARRLERGELRHIVGVPTSEATAQHARTLGIPLTSLDDHPLLDVTVDGADEVDPGLNLIKGRGRALVREKIVALHSKRLIIIVDETKLVARLGKGPLPVEVLPFGAGAHLRWLRSLGCETRLVCDEEGRPILTDNGHYLVMCYFPEGIPRPEELARTLKLRPGIIDHGLFLDMADQVLVGTRQGVQVLTRNTSP